MRGYDIIIRFTSNPNDKQKYVVQPYTQPGYRRLIAWLYHKYDIYIFKVPGFRWFERWHYRRFGYDDLTFLPISVRQDLRCSYLHRQGKEILAEFEIDEATYQSMRAK